MMESGGHAVRGWVNDGEAAAQRGAGVPILSWLERSEAQWRPRQNWGNRSLVEAAKDRMTGSEVSEIYPSRRETCGKA